MVVFIGIHSLGIVAPGMRDRLIARLGVGAFKALYGAVAVIGLVLIVHGFALARREPMVVYVPPPAMRHVAMLLMLPVFPLLFAGYLPGRIRSAAKHPMLVAVKLWAFAHLLANGTGADLVLFGGFLAWAVADRISWTRRAPPAVGPAPPPHRGRPGGFRAWAGPHPTSGTRRAPPALPRAPARPWNDAVAVIAGLALYAIVVGWAHRAFIGVAPMG